MALRCEQNCREMKTGILTDQREVIERWKKYSSEQLNTARKACTENQSNGRNDEFHTAANGFVGRFSAMVYVQDLAQFEFDFTGWL